MRTIVPLLVLATACQFNGVPPGSSGGPDASAGPDGTAADAAVAWALPDYRRRRTYSIDNSNRGTLVGFPVAIRGVAAATMRRGELRVRNASDTADLPFEVELLSGDLLLWVKTDLPDSATTDVRLYYDYEGPSMSDPSDAQATFDGFVGAFHFYQTFDDVGDPVDNVGTGPNFDVVVGLSNAAPTPLLGPALVMDSMTSGQEYVQTADNQFIAPPGAVTTYEMWFRSPDIGNFKTLIDNYQTNVPNDQDCQGLEVHFPTTGELDVWFSVGSSCDGFGEAVVTTQANLEDDTWHHLAVVVDRQMDLLQVYVDGVFDGMTGLESNGIAKGATRLGDGIEFAAPFFGAIDEFRVSNVPRSDDWIGATFDNARIGSTMVTDGGEQVRP